MKDYIEAVKAGNLVEAKKQFNVVMESIVESHRQEIRIEIAEAIRVDGEEDVEPDDEGEGEDKGPKNGDQKPKKDPKPKDDE